MDTIVRRIVDTNGPVLVNSLTAHSRFAAPEGVSIPSAEACIGVPFRDAQGDAIGALCVFDTRIRTWNDLDLDLLVALVKSCTAEIALQQETLARRQAEKALAHSETRLSVIADHLPGLVFERRKSGPSSARYTFFGSTKQNIPGLRGLIDGDDGPLFFIHAEDRDRVRTTLSRATAAETDLDLTFRVLNDDGTVRWLRSQSAVRHDKDGTALWDGLCFDISDLVAAREAADAARHAKETLLVDVNHELRTPVQAIIGFTEFLKTETNPDVVRTHALTIQNAGKALLAIINQLLDLAGAEGNASVPNDQSPTNIKMLAETCHAMVAPLAFEKSIRTDLIVDADVPPLVTADGPKIQQVLVNLLNNAIKFTEEGTVALHVSRVESGLHFGVSDTGVGIAADKIPLLFQRFSRIEADRNAIRGTGLGLAIAKQLVEGMGGTIGVESHQDRGTTFWFEVHAEALAAAPVEPAAASTELHRSADSSAGSGARILIADDLDLNRKLIADMLSLEGHETDCVSDGAAAVRAAGERRYDLILMDMIMPVMDGITATRAIRALPAPACDVPIIALTAHTFKEQLDTCLAAGMDATLTKPMSLDILTATVRSWTTGRSQAA